MKDVAHEAGVSVATVSHVLNQTRYVSSDLSARVGEAICRLGYTPNATARSLRLRKTYAIGLIVPDIGNPFFAELARIVEEEGFASGYTTVIGNADGQRDREHRYLRTLVSKQVDGLILASAVHTVRELEAILPGKEIPVVLLDRGFRLPGVDVVLADHFSGGYQATEHLLKLGHQRIACISGPASSPPSIERTRGYRLALENAGIKLRRQWCVHADFQYRGGLLAMKTLLNRGAGFTAVFAANDLMALGAMRELTNRGISVPHDVSVVGFDDAPLAEMASPALTTMRQPLAEMARIAVTLLLDRMSNDRAVESEWRVFPAELMVRQSTGVPPTRREQAPAKEVTSLAGT